MSAVSSVVRAVRLAWAPPHPEWAPFGVAGLIVALAGLVYAVPVLLGLGGALVLFCLFFFRDPARVPPERAEVLIAPADGIVTELRAVAPPPELGLGAEPRLRIATFLSVLDVHVNRVPASGRVRRVAYRPGRFLNASLDKASDLNERNGLVIDMTDGRAVAVVQIAGLIARRIVCHLRDGDPVVAGERFGLIRFGSRTDLYLPEGATPLVRPGQRMIGGETAVATLGPAPAQVGECADTDAAATTDPVGTVPALS